MRANKVYIQLQDVALTGHLYMPEYPAGIVIITRGKDCAKYKNRHAQLFDLLAEENMGILFCYLLDPPAEQDYDNPFDIALMAERLEQITAWVLGHAQFKDTPVGYFAVNTATAAALQAMAAIGEQVAATVSFSGRPDLSRYVLPSLAGAVLLITNAEDVYITELNRQAHNLLNGENRHIILEGAAESFENTSEAAKIAKLCADWFTHHFDRVNAELAEEYL
jgi:putative phosphoribosyl transferase